MSYSDKQNQSRPPVRNYQPQPPQPTVSGVPETFILECNRQTSITKSADSNTRWTTETGGGGFQIKEGDAITITNSFLSSIGTGNLIGWDNVEGSDTQDNRGCWLYSFYTCNDGLNDKREGYNMLDTTSGAGSEMKHTGGIGRFPFDTDNSPCPLMRVQKSNDVITGDNSREHGDAHAGNTFSWMQDPYLKCRFFSETFSLTPSILDNHIKVEIAVDLQSGIAPNIENLGTGLKFYYYTSNNVQVVLDPRKFLSRGSCIKLIAQDEPYITANPSLYNNPEYEFIFTIFDVVQRTGIDNDYYARVEDQGIIIPNSGTVPAGGEKTITCKIQILPLGGRMSSSTVGDEAKAFYGTLLPKDRFIEDGDKMYLFKHNGLSMVDIVDNNTSRNYGTLTNDANTKNIPLSIVVSSSPTSKSSLKEPITILKYKSVNFDNTRFQSITFRFENINKHNTINTPTLFREYWGTTTNIICIDDAQGNLLEQINFYLWKTGIDSYNIDFITHTDGKPAIVIDGCLRGVNLMKDNYTTNSQPITDIITEDNSEGTTAYFVHLNKYFGSYTCTYGNKDLKQYQSTSIDYSPTITTTRDTTPYYGFMKLTDDQLLELVAGGNTIKYFKNRTNTDIYNSFGDISLSNDINDLDYIPVCYNGFQNISQTQQNVKHYQQFQFKIDENYSSPADIGTELTKQTHKIGNIIDKDGNDLGEANTGLIQNNFFIPVWTSANAQNVENNTKELGGTLDTGSFFLEYTMYNGSNNIIRATFDPDHIDLVYPINGDYKIYFRTKYTCINKPTSGSATPVDGNRDFLQVPIKGDNPTLANVRYAITYGANPTPSETDPTKIRDGAIGYPLEYAPNCFVSQYSGANNISFSWDDSNSRFNIDYLHQPAISKFEASSSGVVQDGGNIVSTIYFPTPVGGFFKNNLYKMPRTRCGGINIENWCSFNFENIKTPYDLRTEFNIPNSQTLDGEWFLFSNKDTDVNYDVVSNRFWNKLGFIDNQIFNENVGFIKDQTTGRYNPKGTTDNRIVVADALITAKEPAENTPRFDTEEEYDGGSSKEKALYQFGSIGSLEFNNHLTGYGLPNSSGVPLAFRPNSTSFNAFQSTYNPDRERNTAYTFETEGEPLQAKTLPTKTEYPYFFVMSDIIETNFYTSANQGSKLNVIGIISKLNAEQDFYFTYQSPLTFYASKDKIISYITTEIRTPDLREPSAISPYSSVIYTITRFNPQPIQPVAPLFLQQEQYFSNINNIANMMAKQPEPSKVKQIQALITLLGQEALQPTAEYSTTTDQLVNQINTLDLSRFRNNPRGLRMFLENDPIGQDVLTNLNTYTRFQPQAPSLIGGLQPTAQNILNQFAQAPIRQNPPADEEAINFMGTRIEDLPRQPMQTQTDPQDIYRQIIDTATQLGRLGASAMDDDDIRQLAGGGISEELLEDLRRIAQTTYRSAFFRDIPLQQERERIDAEIIPPQAEDLGDVPRVGIPTTREGIKDFASDSGVSSIPPSYRTQGTLPPSYRSAPPSYITDETDLGTIEEEE